MKIGIDFHTVSDFMQGSRTYVYNLTKALIERDKKNKYYLYCTNKNYQLPDELCYTNVRKIIITPASRYIRLPISFPIVSAYHKIDIFHFQYFGPPFLPTKYVVTLHDILHERYPEFYPRCLRAMMSMTYPFSAKKAAKILTVSEYSKKDIVRIYNVPDEQVIVAYDAVSEKFHPSYDDSFVNKIKEKYNIFSRYILFVGRLEPRKNISSLITAYHYMKTTYNIPQKLVIAGMKDFKFQELFDQAIRLKMDKDVVFTGRVDQDDLPFIYNGADLFVYPSFAEGFGLPPLEAMACGVPVITSNTTSLPEVIGDAGIMFNPWDIKEICNAMQMVLFDTVLQRKLIARGLKQAKKFSWQKSAEKVLKCYEDIYEKKHKRR